MFLLPPVFVAYFFSVVLVFKWKKKFTQSSFFLSLFYFFWGSTILAFFLGSGKRDLFSSDFNILFTLLFFAFLVTIPPSIYIYSTLVLSIKKSSYLQHYYFPFALLIINVTSFIYLLRPDSSYNELSENVSYYINMFILLFAFPLSNFFYIYKSMELYIKYKRNYVKGSANESELNFNWVLFFLLGYIVFLILLFSDIANILPKFPVSPFMVYTVLYLLYVGYYGIFRKNNLTKDLAVENQESDDETASKTFEGIAEKLEEILQKEKPYLDSKLTIDQLAKKINTNAKYLSNFLNSNHGMNFPTFINTHRIAESKALLLSDETSNFTIETIANMAGFHSKSSFNTAFKKATGLTPSEFKKKIAS